MDVLGLICGLALFLFGMDLMGNALKRSAGKRLKRILGELTSNKLKGFLLGLGVTAIIQSSSATTVMVVGFVNSGTMLLSQAVGVIMGANVGTAVTAWITALNGISGGSGALAFLNYLKPDFWMPLLAIFGVILIMASKKQRTKDIATILLGFAVLMVGMTLMSDAVSSLKDNESFTRILTVFSNPILGVLAGTLLTVIVQSSSASIGILQALSTTGAISFSMAIPIILGQNIGTCVTAMISSLGANKNGKRAAFVHLYFNVFGVIIWLSLYYLIAWLLGVCGVFNVLGAAEAASINMWGIAIVHTVFKILNVITFAPFTKFLEKLACLTVRGDDKVGDEYTNMLDERLLDTPTVAIERSRAVAAKMASLTAEALKDSVSLLDSYDKKAAEKVREAEERSDIYEDALASYLVKLSSRSMDEADSREVTMLLHMVSDLERIGDHAVNIVEAAEEMQDGDVRFSEAAKEQLSYLYRAVCEIVSITERAFCESDVETALLVEPLEQVVDDLRDEIRRRHVSRLQKSECTLEHGFLLSEILTNLERVADHCSNIAGCLIEMTAHDSLDIHGYLRRVRASAPEFKESYASFSEKYSLPRE
ncbi:MAG: Na/Pi cotransporter family protein [Clostridia bacterium]|nr:Na/Pi cotransporter family protein [Clostridia bacterium]